MTDCANEPGARATGSVERQRRGQTARLVMPGMGWRGAWSSRCPPRACAWGSLGSAGLRSGLVEDENAGKRQRARSASDGLRQRARSASDGMVERQRRGQTARMAMAGTGWRGGVVVTLPTPRSRLGLVGNRSLAIWARCGWRSGPVGQSVWRTSRCRAASMRMARSSGERLSIPLWATFARTSSSASALRSGLEGISESEVSC